MEKQLKKITKLLAVVLVLLTVFSVSSIISLFKQAPAAQTAATTEAVSGDTTAPEETTAEGETTMEGQTTAEGETTAQGETTAVTAEGDTTAAGATDAATTAKPANALPTTDAEILAEYTKIMNGAKTAKPGFTKREWQELPEDQRNVGGAVKYLLPLAEMFMTKGDPEVIAKGGDMREFPIKKSPKGCLLTNAGAIKSADCVTLSNGNRRITIVLKDEKNPEVYKEGQAKATSNTGNMFFILAKSDIDNELNNNSTVKRVIKEANYTMTYKNCKATLEYNPATGRIVSLKHYVYTFLDMSGRIIILGQAQGTAVLEMFYETSDFKY